jgi:hypothetical protein
MATSHYREPTKDNRVTARTTPVDTFEDSELDSPGLPRGRVTRSGEQSSYGELSTGKRGGRRSNPTRESFGNPVDPFTSWDSDSTGSVSPLKPRAEQKHNDPRNPQSKLSLDVLDKEPPSASSVPVFLQPFKSPETSSPNWKGSTTPADLTDDILDFSGGEASPSPNLRRSGQSRRQELLKSEGKSVAKRRDHHSPAAEDTIQSFHTETTGHSLDSHHHRQNRSISPLSTPGKKGGRREGEARKRFADLNPPNGPGEDLDISWDDLIPTLEDDSKKRNPRLHQHPPLAKQSADHKLLSFAVSNSAKQSKSSASDDPPGLRNHFRRENSEASALGGPSPIQDLLDMSVVPLDMLPDTCLSMDEVLSPVYQTESPPKPEVVTTSRRKPKPSGMFALTAVDMSQSSVEDVSIPELGQLPRASNTGGNNNASPRGSDRSAFNVLTTPKSSRANSILSNPERLREDKPFFTDRDSNSGNGDSSNETTKDHATIAEGKASEPDHKAGATEDHTLASLEMVSQALSSLAKERERSSDSPSNLPLETKDRLSQDSSQEHKKVPSSASSMKKKITGVFSSATKFLSRSTSKDHNSDQDQPQGASTTTTTTTGGGGARPMITRSRANSELSLGNSSVGTHRASLTDRDDDESIELPIGISNNAPTAAGQGVVDAPISTIDISTLKTSAPVMRAKDSTLGSFPNRNL